MREYVVTVQKPLLDMFSTGFEIYLNPNLESYSISQVFALEKKQEGLWGLFYPSVRQAEGSCVAIFRPPALTIPIQGRHLEYIWDGTHIASVQLATQI